MNPVISPRSFFEAAEIIDTYQGLTCWILYSDMHRPLAEYIRENWEAIHKMSSRDCLVCVVDRPCDVDDPYWKDTKIKTDFNFLLSSKPYNRNEHVEIARYLGITFEDMPAFVFFPSVESKDIIVVKFEDWKNDASITNTVSQVMDCVGEAIIESRFKTGVMKGRNAAIEERRDCHLRLEAAIKKKEIRKLLRNVVTPKSVGAAVGFAASLLGAG